MTALAEAAVDPAVARIAFSLLGSGSNGNAMLVQGPAAPVLIDSGLSLRRAQERAASLGLALDELAAICVTHEHADHVLGAGVMARRLGVPVYMTRGTYENLPKQVRHIPRLELFEAGDSLDLAGMRFHSFSVSHDAADPVSYVVEHGPVRLGLATDLGYVSHLVRMRLAGCHALVLETNYCPVMLRQGSYPAAVQQRIRGRLGHLSNGDACSLLKALAHEALRVVVLVHVSDENNTPDRALHQVAQVLDGRPVQLEVARRDGPTRLFEVRA